MWLDFIPAAALFGQNDSDSKIIREAWHGFIIAEKISAPWLFWELCYKIVLESADGLDLHKKIMNTQTQHSRSRCNLPGLLIKQIYLASMLDEEPDCPIQPASFRAFQTLNTCTCTYTHRHTHTHTHSPNETCKCVKQFGSWHFFHYSYSLSARL